MAVRRDVLWGIDFSCRAASIGWVLADGSRRGVVTAIWDDTLPRAERLEAGHDAMYELARELCWMWPAVFVYFEQPSGTNKNLELVYMGGALQGGLHKALREHWRKTVDIRMITSGEWKKKVLGKGNYRKPKKTDTFEYQAIIWCRENNIDVADDNEADGVCVAECARLDVAFA